MWAIVLKIFPLALGEMLSPVVFAIALVLLAGQNRPIAKTFSFLFGDALAVAIIGVFGYLVGAGVLHVSSNTSLSRIIDIVIAVILVALGIKTLLSKPHKDVAKNQSQVSDEHPKSKKGIIELFLFGFILNITNLDSLIFYIAACREIGQGHEGNRHSGNEARRGPGRTDSFPQRNPHFQARCRGEKGGRDPRPVGHGYRPRNPGHQDVQRGRLGLRPGEGSDLQAAF
jgi:threonine/homoserine/homoserine lactone efflux protein